MKMNLSVLLKKNNKVLPFDSLRYVLLLLGFLVSAHFVKAQKITISGLIKDKETGMPVSKSSVRLFTRESNLISGKTTGEKGDFEFTIPSMGEYKLEATAVSYKMNVTMLDVNAAKTNVSILIEREIQDLSGVVVKATGPAVTQKGDTAQFNAAQYKVNPDATTEDLIKKMPGMNVDRSGNVTAQGEQVRKVTVDGKDFFGDDATAALKNIPANAVDKIQLYDRMSDQAMLTGVDDGNTTKAINIITKAGLNNSQFGRISAGIGDQGKYSAGGNVSFFKDSRRISIVGNFNNINQQNFGSQDLLGVQGNAGRTRDGNPPGNVVGSFRPPNSGPAESFTVDQSGGISTTNAIGLNFGDMWGKTTTVTASYFFNNSENDNRSGASTRIFEQEQNILRNSVSNSINNNHRFNARIEFKKDTNNPIFIIPSISFQNGMNNSGSKLNSFKNASDSIYNSNAGTGSDREGYTIKNTIQYRHSFLKKSRVFSMSLNTSLNKNDGHSNIDGTYRFYDDTGLPVFPDSIQKQNSVNNTSGYNIGASISFNEPLGKSAKSQLQLEYNPSYQKNKTDQQTYSFINTTNSKYDSALSNTFENSIHTQNVGLSYRFNKNKDEQMGVTLAYQQTELSSDRVVPSPSNIRQQFSNWLPFAFWRKKINAKSQFRMFMRFATTYPSVNQLQDVLNLTNPLNVTTGNASLRQSLNLFTGGRFSYTDAKTNRSMFTGVFLQRSSDYIANGTWIATTDSALQQGVVLRKGSQLSKPVNVNGYHAFRSYFTFSQPIKKLKTTVNLNTSFLYSRLPGIINNNPSVTNTQLYNLGLSFVSNVSEYVDYNLSYTANINKARTIGIITRDNNYVNHAIGVNFNLLSKSGWFYSNELSQQIFTGLTAGLDRTFTLWTASVGKKFFKNKAGEIRFTVFDILKQNQSLNRTVTNTYLEDVRTDVLSQYFMLTFSYNLKNFGTLKKQIQTEEGRMR